MDKQNEVKETEFFVIKLKVSVPDKDKPVTIEIFVEAVNYADAERLSGKLSEYYGIEQLIDCKIDKVKKNEISLFEKIKVDDIDSLKVLSFVDNDFETEKPQHGFYTAKYYYTNVDGKTVKDQITFANYGNGFVTQQLSKFVNKYIQTETVITSLVKEKYNVMVVSEDVMNASVSLHESINS